MSSISLSRHYLKSMKTSNLSSPPDKPIIVVLDDLKQRVDWLRSHVGDRADIAWDVTVSGFLNKLKAAESTGRLFLVVLDHDLDFGVDKHLSKGENLDKNGHDGRTAARHLTLSDKSIPVLVWSMNGQMALEMENILSKRGFNVSRMMYNFRQIIGNIVDRNLAQIESDAT